MPTTLNKYHIILGVFAVLLPATCTATAAAAPYGALKTFGTGRSAFRHAVGVETTIFSHTLSEGAQTGVTVIYLREDS
jgi:hypothetical protein